ncbi:hypothetical protein [Aeromonas rivipollensis]|uniref:hypothetical protein n=1 Tax=Aeromonas rivipollensis TaxID=948519 RepID=UPI0027D9C2B7|nr:hypothetical protein [uncultured Aeromonas sp.]MDU1141823.1 hypothetical protein [Aeromonas hydrophila]
MRIALLIPLLALGLAGCSNTSASGASVGLGSGGYYGSHYGASYWWYDDYYGYWNDYYPWCCDNQGDFDELIKKWWSGLDPERQQEIKEKYQDWQETNGQPDVAALRGELAGRWNAMTPEQQQALRDNRQNRTSVSNPDKGPRSPLDYRVGTLPSGDNGMLLPTPRPKVDNGLLTPGTQPKADGGLLIPSTLPKTNNGILTPGTQPRVDTRPHLPRSMVTPVRAPTVRPAIRPGFTPMRSFGGGRRR